MLLDKFKNHPFPVDAYFNQCIVLTFAAPKEELAKLIPHNLELDVFDNKWAFLAVAIVQTTALRPKGFPKQFGQDFILIGYRVFVRYKTSGGKRIRGLYILKSQTDRRQMKLLGNLFTHYKYSTTDIQLKKNGDNILITSINEGIKIHVQKANGEISLPLHSPFENWQQARRFSGPLPFTFTSFTDKNEVLIVEGARENWHPEPVMIRECVTPFLDTLQIENCHLSNAFIINNVPYHWKKGRIDKCN